MTAAPRVSVVVASYNHAPFVAQALASVLAQAFADFEIVVVDDGSGDASADILRALDDPRIRLEVFPENRGACVALNHGIRRARGEYIAILNSDDGFAPGKLARQVAFLDAHAQVGAVFAQPAFVDERGEPYLAGHKDQSVFAVENRGRHAWLRHFFDAGNCLCHPTAMIRRAVYDAVGLYDERLAQVPDLDQWIRVARRFELHVMPERLTHFRILDGLRNASAARPEVVIRDAWERAHILRHYLDLPAADFAAVFPELARAGAAPAVALARHAIALGTPFHVAFGLDVLFAALPPQEAGAAGRELIGLTGAHDLFGIFRAPLRQTPAPESGDDAKSAPAGRRD